MTHEILGMVVGMGVGCGLAALILAFVEIMFRG